MSKSKPKELGEQHSLWVFRDLVDGQNDGEALEAACEKGRVERWGHAARIPLWAGGDEVVLVVDGTVVADRSTAAETVRLTRGDGFGKTARGRLVTGSKLGEDELKAVGETTICSIPRDDLRRIWEAEQVRRRVEAGRWFQKEEVEVPLWPLLGTMPTTRLARILVHLVENYGEVDGGRGRLPVVLRPAQIAELAGVEKRRAARVWGLFERAGLVDVDGGAVVLTELATLRQYALG